MSCGLCKKININIEKYTNTLLMESNGSPSESNTYISSFIKNVEKYPPLKNELNTAYENINVDFSNLVQSKSVNLLKELQNSIKKHAEVGFKKVMANDGKDFNEFLLNSNKNLAPKIPNSFSSKKDIRRGIRQSNLHLDLSFVSALSAQAYVDFLFRKALPSEVTTNILLPYTAKLSKKKKLSESGIKAIKELDYLDFPDMARNRVSTVDSPYKLDWHLVLDIVGTIDPFGVADGTNILLYYKDYVNAANNFDTEEREKQQKQAMLGAFGSFVGLVIPYVGDIGKFSIKTGVKVTNLIVDLQPLIKKLTEKIATSAGLKKKFYQGILNLLKDSPEKVVDNVIRGRSLKPAGIAAFKNKAQEAVSNYFQNRLKQITIPSVAFQATVFGLMKTDLFGPIASYIMGLPLVAAEKVIDGLLSFVLSTTIANWSSEINRQSWLDDHPTLRTMIIDYLNSKELKNAMKELDVVLKKPEQEAKPIDPRRPLYEDKKNIKIIVEKKVLNEAFNRLFLSKTLKRISDLLAAGENNIKALLDEYTPVYKAYTEALKSIDDALTATKVNIKTVESTEVRIAIRNFIITAKRQINDVILKNKLRQEDLKLFKDNSDLVGNNYVLRQGAEPIQINYRIEIENGVAKRVGGSKIGPGYKYNSSKLDIELDKLKKDTIILEKRSKELSARENAMDVPDSKARKAAVGDEPITPPKQTFRAKIKRFAVELPLIYVGSYIVCQSVAHTTIAVIVANWIKENFVSKAFYSALGSAGGISFAWLTANLAQNPQLAGKLGVLSKYLLRSATITTGCWDGMMSVFSKDLQKATEITFANEWNESVNRMKEVEKLTPEETEEMLILLNEEGAWANIKELIWPPYVSTTRGSVADGIINEYSSAMIIKNTLSFSNTLLTSPEDIPAKIKEIFFKKFFIPTNVSIYISRLSKIIEGEGITDPEIHKQIILCIIGDFISKTIKNAEREYKGPDQNKIKQTITSLYIFLFAQRPPDNIVNEQSLDTIIESMSSEIKKRLQKGIDEIQKQAARVEIGYPEGFKDNKQIRSLFKGNDSLKYLAIIKKWKDSSDQDKATKKIDLEKQLNQYENNIQNLINNHKKQLDSGKLNPAQKQYHTIHYSYYSSILEKLKKVRRDAVELDKPDINLDIQIPFMGTTVFSEKGEQKSINITCQDLYNVNRAAYQKLAYIVLNMKEKIDDSIDPNKAVEMSDSPTPSSPTGKSGSENFWKDVPID